MAAPAPIDRQRQSQLKKMPENLRQVAEKVHELGGRATSGLAKIYYDIGVMISRVTSSEEFPGDAVDQIARYTGAHGGSNWYYKLKAFAETFERTFVHELSERPFANGQFLTISHWLDLMKLEDPTIRKKAIDEIFSKSLTTGETTEYIGGLLRGNRTHSRGLQGGRPQGVPSSTLGCVSKLIGRVNGLLNYEKALNEVSAIDAIITMPPDKITNDLLVNLETARETITSLDTRTEEMLSKIIAAEDRVRAVLANGTTAATDEAAGDEGGGDTGEKPSKKPGKKPKAKPKVATRKPVAAKPPKKKEEKPAKKTKRPSAATV